MNDILQWIGVGLIMAAALILPLIRRRRRPGGSGCGDCTLCDGKPHRRATPSAKRGRRDSDGPCRRCR
ncbi:MAG: hypothetical protein K2F71_08100 [Paramuribaculum sp.]|nr:hypothetical protein [Paramuribaculum sp.]